MNPIEKSIQIVNYRNLLDKQGNLIMDDYEKIAKDFLDQIIYLTKKIKNQNIQYKK
jgi:hypothetical protein